MLNIEINCFGPLSELLGWRNKIVVCSDPTTPKSIALQLGLQVWIDGGLTYHVNGKMVTPDFRISDDCELALLPPVSGG